MSSDLQDLARRHLWLHFTRMGSYADHDVPIIVRGDGCYVYDEHGKRYLDGLSARYCVNVGHGRDELAEAAAAQARELGFYTNWSYAHPRAIELAARVAELAPPGRGGASGPPGPPIGPPPLPPGFSSRRAERRPWSRRGSSPASTTG